MGLAGLAAALKGHPGLTYLELGCNALGEEGIKSLADAIKFDVPVRPGMLTVSIACHSGLQTLVGVCVLGRGQEISRHELSCS